MNRHEIAGKMQDYYQRKNEAVLTIAYSGDPDLADRLGPLIDRYERGVAHSATQLANDPHMTLDMFFGDLLDIMAELTEDIEAIAKEVA